MCVKENDYHIFGCHSCFNCKLYQIIKCRNKNKNDVNFLISSVSRDLFLCIYCLQQIMTIRENHASNKTPWHI